MTSLDKTVTVRMARRGDCQGIMELKMELAVHQDMGHLPMLSVEELCRDGFDTVPPRYHCVVAEDVVGNGAILGYALYFYAFTVSDGKALHLEDLCVASKARGKGVGSKLFKELAKIALEQNCNRMQLEVLDWNNSAKKFYEWNGGRNVTKELGFHNFRMGRDAIGKLVLEN